MSSFDINRKTIYDILVDIEINKAYSNIEVNNKIKSNNIENSSFIREMVFGIIKNQYLLDFYINQYAKKVDKKDMILLRMGLYQLLYMNSVPPYAAISTTVDLAKKVRYGKDKFINGVLRNLSRNLDNLSEPNDLSTKYSIESWIIDLLRKTYTDEEIENILIESNKTPLLSIRVNIKKTNKDALKEKLISSGFEVFDSNYSNRGLYVKGKNVLDSNEYKEGLFSIQDQSSIVCIDELLKDYDNKNEFIIDTCAAPGGKSLSIREVISNDSNLLSCDIYDNKLKLISNEANRLGLNINTLNHDATSVLNEYIDKADRVLCDVPCSGLGILRKKPEIKYKKLIDFDILLDTQYSILSTASKYIKDNGIIVYSTCTINDDENNAQVNRFLKENNNFVLEKEIKYVQNEFIDGFYIAKLRKNASRI